MMFNGGDPRNFGAYPLVVAPQRNTPMWQRMSGFVQRPPVALMAPHTAPGMMAHPQQQPQLGLVAGQMIMPGGAGHVAQQIAAPIQVQQPVVSGGQSLPTPPQQSVRGGSASGGSLFSASTPDLVTAPKGGTKRKKLPKGARADGKQAFSCHYCRQKRTDIVSCNKQVEGHRWCGSCVRNHLGIEDLQHITDNKDGVWPDGCPRCTKTCTCSHCRVRVCGDKDGVEGDELDETSFTNYIKTQAVREKSSTLPRGTSCHYCRQKKTLFAECNKSPFHRWCASCVKNGFSVDFESLIKDKDRVWPSGCPICTSSCHCSLCRKRSLSKLAQSETQLATFLLCMGGNGPADGVPAAPVPAKRQKKQRAVPRPSAPSAAPELWNPNEMPGKGENKGCLGLLADACWSSPLCDVKLAPTPQPVAAAAKSEAHMAAANRRAQAFEQLEQQLEQSGSTSDDEEADERASATATPESPSSRLPCAASSTRGAERAPSASPTSSKCSDSPPFSPCAEPLRPSEVDAANDFKFQLSSGLQGSPNKLTSQHHKLQFLAKPSPLALTSSSVAAAAASSRR